MSGGNGFAERVLASYATYCADQRPAAVKVPAWGETVYIFPASLKEVAAVEALRHEGSGAVMVETIIQRCKDQDGNPLFNESHRAVMLENGVDPLVAGSIWSHVQRYDKKRAKALRAAALLPEELQDDPVGE